jgi:hypothetical protein
MPIAETATIAGRNIRFRRGLRNKSIKIGKKTGEKRLVPKWI